MTTWCRPDIQQQQATVSERRCANKKQQQQQQRHSIADILGWTATNNSEVKVEGGVVMMASSFQDSDMMQMNDEPLDLSLDKSKCRAREREAAAAEAATTGIKRSKNSKSIVVHDDLADDDPMAMNGVSGHVDIHDRDREVDEDGEPEMWPSDMMVAGQTNQQQMAHLYMMMLAARLMQSNEAVRYQESQSRRGGEDGGSSDDVGDDGQGSDPMAVATAAAAAAAAAAGLLGHHQLNGSGIDSIGGHPAAKRRKKDQVVMVSDDPTANGTRPRKTRTTFTGKQLFELERIFEQKKYLSSNERQEVARLLNVTGSQIKIWFQNRRTKWKKQDPSTAAELAQLKSASRSSSSQQQQQPLPGKANQTGSSSADQMGLGPTDEEAHTDESSPSGPSSPL